MPRANCSVPFGSSPPHTKRRTCFQQGHSEPAIKAAMPFWEAATNKSTRAINSLTGTWWTHVTEQAKARHIRGTDRRVMCASGSHAAPDHNALCQIRTGASTMQGRQLQLSSQLRPGEIFFRGWGFGLMANHLSNICVSMPSATKKKRLSPLLRTVFLLKKKKLWKKLTHEVLFPLFCLVKTMLVRERSRK